MVEQMVLKVVDQMEAKSIIEKTTGNIMSMC